MNFGLSYAGGGGLKSGAGSDINIGDPSGKISTLDAFGRLRVSEPHTLIDLKQIYDDLPLFYETVSGSNGDANYEKSKAATVLTASSDAGSFAIRQTKRYFNYQTGKSLQFIATFNFEGQDEGHTKRVGYFDDDNGIFFENDGTQNYMVIRSSVSGSPIENRVPQSSWSLDTFDGSGPSGVNLDISKTQIFLTDFQWLGVGSVRVGFSINGVNYYAHQFDHANQENTVYMQTPNLPCRWEIRNPGGTGAGSTMQQICSTVLSEGGIEETGIIRSVNRGVSGALVNNDPKPIVGIRLKSDYNRATVRPVSISILPISNHDINWLLVLNPEFTGGNAPSWNDAGGENSWVESDINRNGTYVTGSGVLISTGYSQGAGGNQSTFSEAIQLPNQLTIASDYSGTSDELYLIAQKDGGQAAEIVGTIKWLEVL